MYETDCCVGGDMGVRSSGNGTYEPADGWKMLELLKNALAPWLVGDVNEKVGIGLGNLVDVSGVGCGLFITGGGVSC